jgi:hypothetical protein
MSQDILNSKDLFLEFLRARLTQGDTISDLAKELQCNRKSIYRRAEKWGIELTGFRKIVKPKEPRPKPVARPTVTPPPPQVTIPKTDEITEAFVEQTLIACATNNPTDPRVAALLIQWLDKKKAIQPTRNDEIEEQNAYTQEYRSIQDEIFTTSDIDEID